MAQHRSSGVVVTCDCLASSARAVYEYSDLLTYLLIVIAIGRSYISYGHLGSACKQTLLVIVDLFVIAGNPLMQWEC